MWQQQSQSPSYRRDVLWNVTDPGDPYDIKKSMIARLPGDKKVFMGQHLEMVCLLQAAQIQRLCQFLQDYRLKFRQIERSNLDRHSYEVQIKELTEQLAGQEALRNENSKIKQFSKRLQIQNSNLQSQGRDMNLKQDNFKGLYSQSLERVNQLTKENSVLMSSLQEYRLNQQSFNARQEALEKAKNKQIQSLKVRYSQLSSETMESTLTSLKLQHQSQIRKYDMQIRSLRDKVEEKNKEIIEMNRQYASLQGETGVQRQQGEHIFKLERQLSQYENRFMIFGQEIERLNITLRDYITRLEQSDKKKNQYYSALRTSDQAKRDLQMRLNSKSSQIAQINEIVKRLQREKGEIGNSIQILNQHQIKIQSLNGQNQQLKSRLRLQIQNFQKCKEQVQKLRYQSTRFEAITRDNNQLKQSAHQLNILRRQNAEFQNKLMVTYQQIQRLGGIINNRDSQLQRQRVAVSHHLKNIDQLQEIVNGTQKKYEVDVRQYQTQISRLKTTHQQELQSFNNVDNQWQFKLRNIQNELEKMSIALRDKNIQNQQLRVANNQLNNNYSRIQLELGTKLKNYELNIANLKRQNQQLSLHVKNFGEADKKAFALQSKLKDYERQFENIRVTIINRQNEITGLRNQLAGYEGHKIDLSQKLNSFQASNTNLETQNQNLKRKLHQTVHQSNVKISQAAQQIQRLINAVRKKQGERLQLEKEITRINFEVSQSRSIGDSARAENEELRRRYAILESQINSLSNESTSNLRAISSENQNLKRRLQQFQVSIRRQQQETRGRVGAYQQNASELSKQVNQLRRINGDYEAKLIMISQQLQRLQQRLQQKTEEAVVLTETLKRTTEQYQAIHGKFRQYEIQVHNRFEGDIKNRFASYQQTVEALSQENNNLKKRGKQYQDRIGQYSIQLERITQKMYEFQQNGQKLKQQMLQKDTLLANYQGDFKNKINVYEGNLAQTMSINGQLQRKLADLDKLSNSKVQQNKRLDIRLRQLTGEIELLRRQSKENEYRMGEQLRAEAQRKYAQYQQRIARSNQQRDGLQRQINKMGQDFNQKLNQGQNNLISLTQDYENIKNNYNRLGQENQQLQMQLQGQQSSIVNYQGQIKLRFKNYEDTNQQLRANIQQLNASIASYQSKFALLSSQIERLTSKLSQVIKQNQALKAQLNQQQHSIGEYNVQINNKIINYEQNIGNLKRQNEQLQVRIKEYQQRLIMLSQEHQKVIQAYELKSKQSSSLSSQYQQFNAQSSLKMTNLQRERQQLILNLQQGQQRSKLVESKVIQASQELGRISHNLQLKTNQARQLEQVVRRQTQEIETLRAKYGELQAYLQQELNGRQSNYQKNFNQLKNRNNDLQVTIATATQQIQRLNNILRLKVEESIQLGSSHSALSQEYEEFKRRVKASQNNLTQTQSNLNREKEELTRQMQKMQQSHYVYQQDNDLRLADYEAKFMTVGQEIQRLNTMLRSKAEQNRKITQQYRNYEQSMSRRLDVEVKSTYQKYEQSIHTFRHENSELNNKLQQSSVTISQYQQKFAIVSQEIQRLNMVLKQRDGQLSQLDLNLRQSQQELQGTRRDIKNVQSSWSSKYESEIKTRIVGYEENIGILKRQKDQLLKIKYDYEGKLAVLGQQIERLNQVLGRKAQENKQLIAQLQNWRQTTQGEYVTLQNNYNSVVSQYQNAKNHMQQYEISINKLYAEFERLQKIINDLKKQKTSIQQMNHNLSQEINRLTAENIDLEQQTKTVRLHLSDQTSLQKRLNQQLSLMVILFAEIQSLRRRVKDKEIEVAQVRRSSLAPNILA